jgi:hypothetical protein
MFVHPTLHLMLARRHREELAAAADRHRRVRSLDHPKGVTVSDRTLRRIGTVVLAPLAALAAWTLIRLAGIDLTVSAGDGTVGPADVFTAALVGALAGWIVVRVLEPRTSHPRLWWSLVGSTALSVSTIGPSWLADGGSAVALIGLHFLVAVVVIGGFAGTLPVCECDPAHGIARSPQGDAAR